MIRVILLEDDPLIKEKMPDVPAIDDEVCRIIQDLSDTMLATGAAGFAANQIGKKANICVVRKPKNKYIALVNPKITAMQGKRMSAEGCFSIPDYYAYVPRSTKIVVQCLGKTVKLTGDEARFAQHEIDHLHGVLIRDYVENTHGRSGGVLMRLPKSSE